MYHSFISKVARTEIFYSNHPSFRIHTHPSILELSTKFFNMTVDLPYGYLLILGHSHSPILNSTVQYSTVQYSTVQYSTVQYSTVQYMPLPHTQLERSPTIRCPHYHLSRFVSTVLRMFFDYLCVSVILHSFVDRTNNAPQIR
jgi:hypothetical protein